MTSNEILKADVLDILFDNRNKQYGAYVLRKNYNQRLGIALGTSLGMAALLFILIPGSNLSDLDRRGDKPVVQVSIVDLSPVKKIDPVIPKKTMTVPKAKEVPYMNPIIKKDIDVKTTMATQTDLSNSVFSNRYLDGPPATDMPVINNPPPTAVVKDDPPKQNEIVAVQREPEFPGGVDAWLKFLQRNLVAPEELQAGETKTVSIRFYVSTDGIVTDFEVLKSAGKSFDNEVIRVLKKMPRWKPAIQNGLPVARAFTQPVTFMGVEQ